MYFSTIPPVLIRRNRNGGTPIFHGIGNNQGTPSLVNVSITRWEINPIRNAYQTKVVSTSTQVPNQLSVTLDKLANRTIPTIECEISL